MSGELRVTTLKRVAGAAVVSTALAGREKTRTTYARPGQREREGHTARRSCTFGNEREVPLGGYDGRHRGRLGQRYGAICIGAEPG